MTNEIIGIVIALASVLLLFVLRHFILPSQRANNPRTIRIADQNKKDSNREESKKIVWPLRPLDFETPEPDYRPKPESANEMEGQGLRNA